MAQASSSSRTPPLSSAIIAHIASDWIEFAEIWAAARALSQKSRLTNALSIAVNEVRVALAAGRARAQAMALSCDDEAVRSGLRPFSERCACTRTHGRSSQTARELWRWSGTYIRSSDSEGARSVWLSRWLSWTYFGSNTFLFWLEHSMVETEFFVQRHPSKRRGKEDHPRSTKSKMLKM